MNMVEKVARNVFERWRERMDSNGDMLGPRRFDDMNSREMEFAIGAARAAIEAMREPTEAMIKAAWADARAESASPIWETCVAESAAAAWTAMIDAALNEKA